MGRERGEQRERERESGVQVTKERRGTGGGCKLQSTKFAAAP